MSLEIRLFLWLFRAMESFRVRKYWRSATDRRVRRGWAWLINGISSTRASLLLESAVWSGAACLVAEWTLAPENAQRGRTTCKILKKRRVWFSIRPFDWKLWENEGRTAAREYLIARVLQYSKGNVEWKKTFDCFVQFTGIFHHFLCDRTCSLLSQCFLQICRITL